MSRGRRLIASCMGISIIVLLLVLDTGAMAGEWKLVGSIAAKEEYNDNLFFDDDDSENDKTDDFITTISPKLELSRETERLQLGVSAKLDRRVYNSENDLNATDQQYLGFVHYALTPKLSFSGSAGYKKDSSPDRDLETTGLVMGTKTRHNQNYAISGNYIFSELMTGTLSYDYSKDDFQGNNESNSESNRVNLLLTRDIGFFISMAQARASLGYNRYHFSDSNVDNYQMMVGLSKALSEIWSIQVDMGTNYTRTKFDTLQEDNNKWGFVGKMLLSWKGEKTGINLSLSRDLQPASGLGGAATRTSLIFSATRQFAADWSGNFSGGYHKNKTEKDQYSSSEIDEETLYARVGVKYDLTKDLAIDASYTYSKTDYKVTDSNADRNLMMIRLYYQFAFLE